MLPGNGIRVGQKGIITKGHEETFVGDPSVHDLDCGSGFRGILIC